jgi:hypothetical protein
MIGSRQMVPSTLPLPNTVDWCFIEGFLFVAKVAIIHQGKM